MQKRLAFPSFFQAPGPKYNRGELEAVTLNPQNPTRLLHPPIPRSERAEKGRGTSKTMAAVARVLRGSRFLMSPPPTAAGGKVAKAAAGGGAAKVTKAAAGAGKEVGGIMKPVPVSDAFRSFAGVSEVSRAGAVKLIWDHIKANGLQNPANKREINCDEKLKSLFGAGDKIGIMEIAKLLKPHFVKTN